ncbi:hypothetical protein [Shewanella sp. BC20]|uniref:hypothetical protein n=1 Tax=Shewanella sp. BC20 TaxID=2004459 RepID=UPI0011B1FCD4|nr:hypothetical protein [Shewanella sp. BC20]
MEIYPNKGIGNIKFGMNPQDVKEIMGSDLVYQEWMGGNLNDTLFYSDLIVGFNDCDGDEPLPNSRVVEFRANASERIKFNGVALAKLSRTELASMVVKGSKAVVDKNQDVIFQDLGVSFGFNENGSVCILEMWQQNS